jgi:hypothetical protein
MFRQAAGKGESRVRDGFVDERSRIARAIEAARIEGSAGRAGIAPISGRDVGAAHAQLPTAGNGYERDLDAGQGDAERRSARRELVLARRTGRRFRRTPAAEEWNDPRRRRARHGRERRDERLRQRRGRAEREIEVREEALA